MAPSASPSASGSIWVANTQRRDDHEDRRRLRANRPKTLQIPATDLAFGDGSLWATQRGANRVVRIDPETGEQIATIGVGNGPTGIAFGDGAVWVANSLDGTVTRIDPETNAFRRRS